METWRIVSDQGWYFLSLRISCLPSFLGVFIQGLIAEVVDFKAPDARFELSVKLEDGSASVCAFLSQQVLNLGVNALL